MKRCPRCDFSFADFHRVCDFDGAELVDDPERPPSSVKASPRPSRFRRLLKIALSLDGLAIVALLAGALLIRYYNSRNQTNSIVRNQPAQNASVIPVSPPQNSIQPIAPRRAQTKAPAASTRAAVVNNSKRKEKSSATAQRQPTASHQLARLQSPGPARNQPSTSLAALRRESEDTADRKEPKLTAMLKTTWRILKKPFKF